MNIKNSTTEFLNIGESLDVTMFSLFNCTYSVVTLNGIQFTDKVIIENSTVTGTWAITYNKTCNRNRSKSIIVIVPTNLTLLIVTSFIKERVKRISAPFI